MKIRRFISILLVATAASCNFPEVKTIKFERESSEVIEDLKKLGNFDSANVGVSMSSINGKSTSSLKIDLTNGENLPSGDELKELARKAFEIVVNSIENENDYSFCRVEIVDEQSIGIVKANSKTTFEFNQADLNQNQ
jgi:hypothetical protein